jgi:hypothetical protein
MPPTIPNPSFEADSDWMMVGSAGYYDLESYQGSRCLAMTTGRVGDGELIPYVYTTGSSYVDVTGFEYGKMYRVSVFAKDWQPPSPGIPWTLDILWPDGTQQAVIDAYPFAESAWDARDGAFVALGTSCRLTLAVPQTNFDPLRTVLFDVLTCGLEGGPVAVLLAERAVAQVLVALQNANGLPSELTKIASERGDSITLPSADRWYTSPRAELSSDVVSVEVFAESTRFVDQEKRLPAWVAGVREALPSEVDIMIRLTHANRNMAPLGAMRKRTERYAAAIARVFRNYPTLMDSTGYIRWARLNEVRSATSDAIVDDGGRIVVDNLTFRITVNMNEGSAGEGQAGQGVPPSHTVSET